MVATYSPTNQLVVADSIKKAIENTFTPRYYKVEIANFGKAIRVESKTSNKPGVNIWIRIESMLHDTRVNISSVELSRGMRRQGRFTQMMKDIGKLDCVDSLMIGGVCTAAMQQWCIKNGFVDMSGYSDFILPKSNLKLWANGSVGI